MDKIRRYPHDKHLSWVIDMLEEKERALRRAGDEENAVTLGNARELILTVVLGVPGLPDDAYEKEGARQ